MNEQSEALTLNDGKVSSSDVVRGMNGEYIEVKAVCNTNGPNIFHVVGLIKFEGVDTPTFQKNDDGRILLTGFKFRTFMLDVFWENNWWIEINGLEDVSNGEPRNVLIKADPLNVTEDTKDLSAILVKVENSDSQYALFSGGRIMIEDQESDEWKDIRGAPKKFFTKECENPTDPVKDAGHYFLGARVYLEEKQFFSSGERWEANLEKDGN